MDTQTKWIMGVIAGIIIVASGALVSFFSDTTTKLNLLVTDVAVIKSQVTAITSKNIPSRVSSIEDMVRSWNERVTQLDLEWKARHDRLDAWNQRQETKREALERQLARLVTLFEQMQKDQK